ncbi:MAG: hypothetical protein FJ264_18290 [Planctomycetes bacterium]|nr:hypothetical protein [Planctomycetota bacterium]
MLKIDKAEIVSKLDKAKFYQELMPSLKKVDGKLEAIGPCPLCEDDTNSYLSANLETGLYRCSCNIIRGDRCFYILHGEKGS